jgi:hypothetical protein
LIERDKCQSQVSGFQALGFGFDICRFWFAGFEFEISNLGFEIL